MNNSTRPGDAARLGRVVHAGHEQLDASAGHSGTLARNCCVRREHIHVTPAVLRHTSGTAMRMRRRRGRFLGLPYDWRPLTARRLRDEVWNPAEPRILVPKAYGWAMASTSPRSGDG